MRSGKEGIRKKSGCFENITHDIIQYQWDRMGPVPYRRLLHKKMIFDNQPLVPVKD